MQPLTDTEIELKLGLSDPRQGAAIFALPRLAALSASQVLTEHLETWYFDTPDRALQQAGIAYRLRLEHGNWMATVKAGESGEGGLHQRREWNIVIDGSGTDGRPEPRFDYFDGNTAGPLLTGAAGDEKLTFLFSTAFDRTTSNVTTDDGSVIELALDMGWIIAGDAREPIAEVELELKYGSVAATLALGAELARAVPLFVEPRSKYARALALAGFEPPTGQTPLPAVTGDDRALPALKTLLVNAIHQVFAAQSQCRHIEETADAVYHFRISLHRLMSLLAFAKPLIPPALYPRWQNELHTLAGASNRLRETDVLLTLWQNLTEACPIPLTPPPWLPVMLEAERKDLAEEASAPPSTGEPTAILLEIWAGVTGADGQLLHCEQSLTDFALFRLSKWLRALRLTGKTLDNLSNEELRRLRLDSKKFQYGLEALPLRNRKTKQLLVGLRRLQDDLGCLHDVQATVNRLVIWQNLHASRVIHRDTGLLMGWALRTGHQSVKRTGRTWQRFRRLAGRWLKEHAGNQSD